MGDVLSVLAALAAALGLLGAAIALATFVDRLRTRRKSRDGARAGLR